MGNCHCLDKQNYQTFKIKTLKNDSFGFGVSLITPPLSFQVMKSVHKAGQNYLQWKQENSPGLKPWLYPDQSTLPMMNPAELSVQRADSLENVDEMSKVDAQDGEDSS